MLPEGRLDGMQLAVAAHALDRGDLGAVDLRREDGAALDRLAIEMHGAGPAVGRVAADVGARQAE